MTGQLAFVESPVQLLNVLEWAHTRAPARTPGTEASAAVAPTTGAPAPAPLTVVVLSPTDPMSRGQLRRMAQLAHHKGLPTPSQEDRGGRGGPPPPPP
ncbi:hypothetical protein ACFCY4_30460, partial [Streptomyces sp. NPDC056294]